MTTVVMKNGSRYSGHIWEYSPKKGYLALVNDDAPDRLYFRDMASCITKSARTGQRGAQVIVEDRDEIARALENGWEGGSE